MPIVPHAISNCTDLKSAAGGWTFDFFCAALAPWQNQCINGVYDMEYWSAHGPFNGVFEFISKRLHWNSKRCRKRTIGYLEMVAPARFSHLHAAGLAALICHYQSIAESFPLVPAMVWGPAEHHIMERPSRGQEEVSNGAQWWPHMVHPWNLSATNIGCIWVILWPRCVLP